ncbi:hypothetical protein SKAU_G00375400 [Synaphobranchus kaupii]|uniref:Uncharacterized protein n=1 Tax=Synaphobranchus kaupii TaxID=118154 RepID=A0A9Q1EGZ0_SYNKA|nr:hypothetical protein SKAU_G00375400 [Synaphobranchus kaupii]
MSSSRIQSVSKDVSISAATVSIFISARRYLDRSESQSAKSAGEDWVVDAAPLYATAGGYSGTWLPPATAVSIEALTRDGRVVLPLTGNEKTEYGGQCNQEALLHVLRCTLAAVCVGERGEDNAVSRCH